MMESCVSLVPLMFCLYSLDNLLSCAFFISSTAPVCVSARSHLHRQLSHFSVSPLYPTEWRSFF